MQHQESKHVTKPSQSELFTWIFQLEPVRENPSELGGKNDHSSSRIEKTGFDNRVDWQKEVETKTTERERGPLTGPQFYCRFF